MVMSFDPASSWLGKRQFTAQPEEEGLTGFLPESLQSISSGLSHFDPSSQHNLPTPAANVAGPAAAERSGQTSPGALAAGLPFSAQVGLGTGAPGAGGGGAGGGGTSRVVGNMLRASSAGPAGGGSESVGGFGGPVGESGRAAMTFGGPPSSLGVVDSSGRYTSSTGESRQLSERTQAMLRELERQMQMRESGDRGFGGSQDVGGGGGGFGGGDFGRESSREKD